MTQQLAGDRRIDDLDWAKGDGLLPAIVQDADDGRVLITKKHLMSDGRYLDDAPIDDDTLPV